MSGRLQSICLSQRKGTQKQSVPGARLVAGHGFEGDAHAGDWHRQVSLLLHDDIESMRASGVELDPGAFGENLIITDLDLSELGVGSQLKIESALLEITQIGKVCHSRCAIYELAGDCIMPRLGVFARVIEGGSIEEGAEVEIVRLVPRNEMQVAVVTVSDRCSRGETRDTAGPAVADLLVEQLGAHVAWTGIVPDEQNQISSRLKDLCSRGFDLVLTAGGTGCAPRDVTPEATRKVIDRELPGLAEKMRLESSKITPNAWLQRGVCGIRGHSLIVNLPGSKKAAIENLEFVLDLIESALAHLHETEVHPETESRVIEKSG